MNYSGFLRCATNFMMALLMASTGLAQQTSTTTVNATPVPHLVSYNGMLKDGSGKPVTGITGVTFLLYRDAEGGAPVWMETQNVDPDSAGRYTAQLGATRSEGLPPETFMTGEARWLAVQADGASEQPRVLLVAVPYAMKAADAETIGGLPPSAFLLAASPRSSASGTSVDAASSNPSPGAPPPASTVTTSGGTVNALPLWTTATNVQSSAITQTGSGATARIGINTTAPTTALDVHGGSTIRGTLVLPATGAAMAAAGKVSQPENFIASSFSSATSTPVNQTFQWQATPTNNNTSNPGATLNLLYGQGTATPAQTGLRIGPKGIIGFAPGQTFPGTANGTVTSVGLSGPASDFNVTGSPINNSGTLGLSWNIAPTSANTANSIVKRDANGNFGSGVIQANLLQASSVFVNSPVNGSVAVVGQALATGANQSIGVLGKVADSGYGVGGFNSSNGWGVYGESDGQDGVHGLSHSSASGVAGINTDPRGTGVFGSAPGWAFESDGNALQGRTYGGWVKAMVFINGGTSSIAWCFNSTLAGSAATTPPCGFGFDKTGIGDYIIDFGFQVDDRFFSLTNVSPLISTSTCTDMVFTCNNTTTANQVEISSYYIPNLKFSDAKFYLVVY